MKSNSVEKFNNVGKGEYRVEFILFRLHHQGLDELASDTLRLGVFVDCKRADLRGSRAIEVKRTATQQLLVTDT